MFADVLGAVHQWMDAVKIQYDSWLEVEILEDRDTMFRAVMESKNHLAELIVNEPGFAPYRFVSFQVLGMESTGDKPPLFCFYDDETCEVSDIISRLNEILKNIVVREQFLRASEEFGFEIIMPYCLDEKEQIYAFGYMPGYGSKNGAVIELLGEGLATDTNMKRWCDENGYFCGFLNPQLLLDQYKRNYFRELLRDWRIPYGKKQIRAAEREE